MPLTDPELDLLREMLDEDPAHEAFLQVTEELVRRYRWSEAEEALTRGLGVRQGVAGAEVEVVRAFELLSRAALELGHFDLAATALATLERDPATHPENARLEILMLERSGRTDQARERVERFLGVDPADVVVRAVLERLEAPPPDRRARAADPFYTVERAERYVFVGRKERAIRVYRRILLHSGPQPAIELRLRQLSADTGGIEGPDDLSEELTDPGLVPAEPLPGERDVPPILPEPLAMPGPSLQPTPRPDPLAGLRFHPEEDDFETPVALGSRTGVPSRPPSSVGPGDRSESSGSGSGSGSGSDWIPVGVDADAFDADEEDTDVDLGRSLPSGEDPSRRDRRKRRSLLRR